MPPFIPRKRHRSPSPAQSSKRAARVVPPRRAKENVFQSLDNTPSLTRSLLKTKTFLEDDANLSDPEETTESDEFEDVEITGSSTHQSTKAKGKEKANTKVVRRDGSSEGSTDEDWEDALDPQQNENITWSFDDHGVAPIPSGDLELTLDAKVNASAFSTSGNTKKGPSKIERQIRTGTHCMHVQFLMFHNLVRNAWIEDKKVQKILTEHLSTGCWRELDVYWRDAGVPDGAKRVVSIDGDNIYADKSPQAKQLSKAGKKGNPKSKSTQCRDRNARDWGTTSEHLERNTPNISAGDPLLRLLKYLMAFWRQKFKINAPPLRKRGYLSPATLEAEIAAWREDPSDPDTFGERIENLEKFRDHARKLMGSRDIGQQLFTALLRGLGLEARMITSLQPAGFGWSQVEEGKPKDLSNLKTNAKQLTATFSKNSSPKKSATSRQGTTRSSPINLADSDSSELSSVFSFSSDANGEASPRQPSSARKSQELPHPTYWTEVISHLTYTPIAVSPLPLATMAPAFTPEKFNAFYCPGALAAKAQQVFAYIIAFSSDGSAKDVTTRYLPKRQWPGKTKGFRIPVEKVPLYSKHGKVKRYEEWNWFKSVMRPYARRVEDRKPWDEVEDQGDLIPAKAAKPKGIDEEGGKESLQGYKNSAEFVLERHLRREEALHPNAKIVRYFTTGKGDNEKNEPVYLRKDIVACKTVESWHKEGREVKIGEQPLKLVPTRAVTVARKREIEERERQEGEKVKQGLYSKAQTDWIIPDPIVDGKIPRNGFGNIDVYVPTMIPKGAVHIPLKGTARICKKLNIDFAEACTGFEFGKQRAVPVLTGVVVATENEDLVIDAWEAEQVEKQRKEDEKKEKLVLALWKKFLLGLRIVERMKRVYGDDAELPTKLPHQKVQPSSNVEGEDTNEFNPLEEEEYLEGGFVREIKHPTDAAGDFIPASQEATAERLEGGFIHSSDDEGPAHPTLTIDHGEDIAEDRNAVNSNHQIPISLVSASHQRLGTTSDERSEGKKQDDAQHRGYVDNASEGNTKPKSKSHTYSSRPGPTRSTRGQTSRGHMQRNSTRKSIIDESTSSLSDISTPSSPGPANRHWNCQDAESQTKVLDRRPSPSPVRSTSKRKAARKSDAMITSHYFANESDKATDRSPPKKKGASRGKGRGRGKGRARKSL